MGMVAHARNTNNQEAEAGELPLVLFEVSLD